MSGVGLLRVLLRCWKSVGSDQSGLGRNQMEIQTQAVGTAMG